MLNGTLRLVPPKGATKTGDSVAQTQDERKAETHDKLLAAAEELFAHRGFHGVSAEAIAEKAGRTTGALYSHFGNKEGLLLAVLERRKSETAHVLVTLLPDARDLDAIVLTTWGQIVADAAPGHGSRLLLEVELWLHGARDVELTTALADRYQGMRADLARGFDRFATAANHQLPAPASQLATMTIALLFGAAMQHHLDATALPPEWVRDAVRALVGVPSTGAPTTAPSGP